MHIGIIGSGHAGIEAAVAARQAGAEATLFSAEEVLPYFRPRLVAVAMGQTASEEIAMHPAAWYEERGIRLRLATPATALDVAARTIVAGGVAETFDALVLACGALPRRPRFPGETPATPIYTLWSMTDAMAIRQQVRAGARLVVMGGSSLGIECAWRACEQQLRVTLVEKLPHLMPQSLGAGAAGFLRQSLEGRGMTVHTGQGVASLAGRTDGATDLGLEDGTRLAADLILVCIGAAPNLALARGAGLATGRGLQTDACLQAAPGVFVAGDVCEADKRPARGAVREATAQGRLAGANAVACVAGGQLRPFQPVVVPGAVRCTGLEIYVAGVAGGEGLREERLDEAGGRAGGYRAVVRHADGRVAGVQMVGTREGFDALAGQIQA
ncbi:MAG: NAD(P)/FAD-dependent oxidoreductase [Kiritimatiellia bacterium]